MILQRRFLYIGHELAILLKERHGIDTFCGYICVRDGLKYLKSQKDIAYTNLILDEDIFKQYETEKLDLKYLEAFEREYGSVWKFIGVDRIVRYGQLIRDYPHDTSPYSYEEMLRIVQVYAKNITAFLDAEKPDFIFSYQPGSLGLLLFHAIAEKRGIPVLITVIPNTRDQVTISRRYDRLTWVDEIFKANRDKSPHEIPHYEEAKRFIEEFRNKPAVYSKVYALLKNPSSWQRFDFLFPHNMARTIQWTCRMYADWLRDPERRTDFTTIHPTHYFLDRIKLKFRGFIGAEDLYDEYDRSKSFVYYPLHLEPEMAILLMAPFDTDQRAIIQRLAQSLPAGMYVYVKEHPMMASYRPRSFYKELKKIPNVRLLRPGISSFDLISNCAIVANIAGSAGWEGLLMGKPVITFGTIFYNVLPSVIQSKVPDELPSVVARQLAAPPAPDEDIIRFLAALFEDSAHCDLYYLWEKGGASEEKRSELVDFADLIAKKILIVTGRKK